MLEVREREIVDVLQHYNHDTNILAERERDLLATFQHYIHDTGMLGLGVHEHLHGKLHR